ncbi:MAG: D-2-hydroxyacid dehydrogenase [Chloroflexi bacterium]|nr:D-2-hydroxyacid dehydrogenase [Chloroflexota bacterium]
MNYAISSDLLEVLRPLVSVNLIPVARNGSVSAPPQAVQVGNNVTPSVLAQLLRQYDTIRWLSAPSAGVDPYVLPELKGRHMQFTRPRGIHDAPVSEFALMLLLAAAKRLPDLVRASDRGEWFRYDAPLLRGQTLLIVGYGEIGQALAARAKPLGMRIIGLRRRPEPDQLADEVLPAEQLPHALERADYVVLTAPGGPSNHHLISQRELQTLKPTAHLINVGRGDLVDADALDQALREGRFAGAFLDTFAVEPLPANSPLWANPRVVVTPHAAGVHAPARDPRVVAQIVENIRRFTAGEPLLNTVDLDRGY